ncbi:hypothetical protein [Gracilimonas sp.]|uniref:hypothetical protein n=1 Tax=Gracilimonas sp. TaxID=1974203 RepID=UPI0032ECEB74
MAETPTVTINERTFNAYKLEGTTFNNIAAIYVIICVDNQGKWFIVDVGETGELGDRIENHDRRDCWAKNCDHTLWVCVLSTPSKQYTQKDRLLIEAEIRDQHNPPCGQK